MEVTKVQLAEEVLSYLIEEGLIESKPMSEYSDNILDIQDIFSNYWSESEVGDDK